MNKFEVYVCYVQNYLGLMDGEDVVEFMRVETEQDKVDQWLLERVADGIEDGYVPEEDTENFVGCNDYELTMSKGNEKEGYLSYGIVCRRFDVKTN